MSVAGSGESTEGVRLDELVAELRGRVDVIGDAATQVRGGGATRLAGRRAG